MAINARGKARAALAMGLAACAPQEPPAAAPATVSPSIDAGRTADAPPPPGLEISAGAGASSDDTSPAHGPGLVLMGGGADVGSAFTWMHDVVTGAADREGGDVVVLRAKGGDSYDAFIAQQGRFHSVRTLILAPNAEPDALAAAAAIVDRAEAVFFAGGDQGDYAAWAGSTLFASVARVWQRGGVVGGTSAGCNILGAVVYDHRTPGDVTTPDAVADPFERPISFTRGALAFPPLEGTITEPHFANRDRMGRLAVFMARQFDGDAGGRASVRAIALSEAVALVVDAKGKATMKRQKAPNAGQSAFVLAGARPARLAVGSPLAYRGIVVQRLDRDGQSYDLARACGDGVRYVVDVDGQKTPLYAPADPYTAEGSANACP